MKRRLLSAFLAVMMVLTMAPVAFAADGVEPTDGTGSSEAAPAKTPQQQIDGIEGTGTVTLDKDYTEDITIQQGQNITLNLNGKKLTNKTGHTITVEQGATLTINGVGTVDNVTHAKSALVNYGEVVLNNGVTLERSSEKGTLSPYSDGGNSCYTILNDKGATMTINDATVKNSGGYSSAIRNGGDSECNDESHLTIKDGNFSGGLNAVKNDECGILTIDGGAFSNTSQYVIMNWNKATITNGTFSVKDSADAVLFTAAYHANRAVGELIVNNGTFTGNGSQKMVENHYGSSYTGTASITGGTFSSDVSAYVAEGYVQNNGTVEQLGETNAVAKVGNTYYKTLADAVAAAQSGETVKLLKNVTSANILKINQSITLDLGDYTFELTGSGNTARAIYINDGANVTIKANEKGGVKAATIALQVNAGGKLTIESGTYTGMYALALFSSDTKPAEAILNNGVFNGYIYTNGTGHDDHITFNGGTYNEQVYLASGDKSTYTISNGTFKNSLEIDAGRLDISGGTFTANIDTSGNANHPVTNNNGSGAYVGTLVVCKPDGSSATGYIGDAVVNITGGTFENTFANGETIVVADFGKEQENVGDARVTISDNAKIKGVVKAYASENNTGMNFSITGGYFTTDPSAYVASGYVAGTSDVSGYSYKVVEKTNTGNVEVKPDVAKPEVKVDKIPQADQEKVAAAAATVSAPTLGAAAVDEAQKINEDKANELLKDVNVGAGDKKLYVQSSLKVEPTTYDETTKTLALEITPQYRVVASTADTADKIKLDGNTKNAQVVQDYQTMNITKATVVTMELPTGFAVADGDKLSIQHTKSNDKVEYYTGTVAEQSGKHLLTFTTNGFSPFVISVPAASIGENVYPTLQAAVENVKNNEIIKLAKDVDEAIVVTVAKSIKFTVNTDNKTFNAAKNIVAGSNTTVKVTGESSPYTYEFTYTKPSSGSSGGSSSGKTTYKVTTSAVNNGGVNASPSSAEKGATIAITLSPDKGYKLDKLTVIDGSGKTVSTVKKSDTVYTFTMPASAVKVGVSYVKATETPSKTKFNDVSANDWFASAVDYVTGKGMMNGTADNTFSPKAHTTRGMVVTVLYRLENQPSTSAASFTDVASGAYYANAVAWANANGIVSGYGSGKFGPNDKVTREQLAAILYRYAQYKKYDVSVGEDTNILSYDDAQSISSYAIPAIQWACGAGVVTGKSGSKLDPKGNATRAEVAAMLMRFCENVK